MKFLSNINFPKISPKSFFAKTKFTNGVNGVYLLNLLVIVAGYIYLYNSLNQLPEMVPLFYTLPWGELQLAPAYYLTLVMHCASLILLLNFVLSYVEISKSNFTLSKSYSYLSLLICTLLTVYTVRIITMMAYYPVVLPSWFRIIVIPLLAGVVVTCMVTPFVIRFAKKYGYMDDPLRHKHPGMLLKRPTPRAGGLAYYLGLLIPSIILLPILSSQKLVGIFLASGLCVLMGLKDDKNDIHPILRLVGQIIVIFIAVLSGIILIYIPNPFGTAINLDYFRYAFEFLGEHTVYYWSALAAAIWIGATMNFMSFANGTDGVYAGLVTVASLVISVLMFQSLPLDPDIAIFAKLAAISAGAGLGMAFFTWPPQKLLWGFGATSAGLVIACLSILGSTKVAVMLIVLIIPFLDGIFAVMRRLRRGQMPFWGDREHLHHKLLEGLGWSKQRVALFYWATTIAFGVVGIATSGQARALALAAMSLIFIAGIALLNFVKRPKL